MRLGHRPARNVEALADRKILEIAAFGKAVLARLETLGHGGMSRMFSAQRPAIIAGSMPISARIAAPCSPMRGAGGSAASTANGIPGVRGVGNCPHLGLLDGDRTTGRNDVRSGEPV